MRRFLRLLSALLILCLLPCAVSSAETPQPREDTARFMVFEATLDELSDAMADGQLSARTLTEVYLERIAAYNKQYNAVISFNENALSDADRLDRERAGGRVRGPLHGIPVVIKDNIDVAGLPTTNGLSSRLDAIAETDAEVVSRLKEAGAIILGKTNMSTEAQIGYYTYSNAYGETFNAYNTDYSAAGSSGGSAVAVSANLAAAGLGTDTGISIRGPASLAGLVGLRPTVGLIPMDGIIPLNSYRDVVGPLTRTVTDAAILLEVMTDKPGAYTSGLSGNPLQGKRIGVLRELSEVTSDSPWSRGLVSPTITAAVRQARADLTTAKAEVLDVSLPKLFAYYQAVMNDHDRITAYQDAVLSLMAEYDLDALMFPSYLSDPVMNGTSVTGSDLISTGSYLAPAVEYPAISVPMGYTPDGVPMGIQFMARSHEESLLLEVAYGYEQATKHRVPPALAPNLYRAAPKPVAAPTATSAAPTEPTEPFSSSRPFPLLVLAVLVLIAACLILLLAMLIAARRRRNRPRHRR